MSQHDVSALNSHLRPSVIASQQRPTTSASQQRPTIAASSSLQQQESSSQNVSRPDSQQGFQLPAWCYPPGKLKTALSKTGCPVLDELAEKIHQSGSCSGHQTPSRRAVGSNSQRAALAQAASRLAGRTSDNQSQSQSQMAPSVPVMLSRSRSFPAATYSSRPLPEFAASSVQELEVLDEDGCSAETVRAAADAITAEDPDFQETVPYLDSVSNQLKETCLNQLIALKRKLLREFAEVLCMVERRFTLNYAESLAEAREQQTVARYYQAQCEKYKAIIDRMATALARKSNKLKMMRIFFAWFRQAKLSRKSNSSTDQRESSDGIDIEYQRTEEVGNKVYEKRLTAQLSKAFAEQAHAAECRKYHTGPPCPGPVCRCKARAEKQKDRRIEALECQLKQAKRREEQLLELKHCAENKYRVAVMRGLGVPSSGGDSPSSAGAPARTTTITRRRVAADSDDSTLPPVRVRRAQSEVRRACAGPKTSRRRAKSRAGCRGVSSSSHMRHLKCAPPPAPAWAETAECITSKTLRRPRVRVCAEEAVKNRRGVLAEARCRAAAAAASALMDQLPDDMQASNSSEEIIFDVDPRERARKSAQVTEKWRHLPRC